MMNNETRYPVVIYIGQVAKFFRK
ncbi:hypothetical protein [Lederbergia galactosidilytica]